jgi:hypothetical protein
MAVESAVQRAIGPVSQSGGLKVRRDSQGSLPKIEAGTYLDDNATEL